eukprot:6120866-Pyramimonas_sp.AAC.1
MVLLQGRLGPPSATRQRTARPSSAAAAIHRFAQASEVFGSCTGSVAGVEWARLSAMHMVIGFVK